MFVINLLFFILFSHIFSLSLSAQGSVLSKNNWYKIAITKSGIYKIDGNFLKKAGIDLKQIKPETIQVFGNGGKMLPQANAEKRAEDLMENAIMLIGMEDGIFDSNDYLMFFGESPHTINYDSENDLLHHTNHYYSDSTFYFFTFGHSLGLRVAEQKSIESSNQIESLDFFDFHEIDSKNMIGLGGGDLGGSGREWYGENLFSGSSVSFDLNTLGIVSGSKFRLFSSVLGNATSPFLVDIRLNKDSLVGQHRLKSIGNYIYDTKGIEDKRQFEFISKSLDRQTISYSITENGGQGFINYFEWQFRRKIQFYQEQFIAYCTDCEKLPDIKFTINNKTSKQYIWDISEKYVPKYINQQTESIPIFTINSNYELKKIIFFSTDNLLIPQQIYNIDNQNLHQYETPNLLIISPKKWISEAERLANFRQKYDGLSVQVVELSSVYNEFSSGSPDPTAIRDFVRHLWLKNPTELKYLLLFGDASYDYKNLIQFSTIEPNLQIPTYQSRESLNPITSFSSDDYFGFMEESEGDWIENNAGNHTLDIAVGRLPVKTAKEAKEVVDKLIYYSQNPKSFGEWRKKILFVADDGDANIHQKSADELASIAQKLIPDIRIDKFYLDDYPLVSSANGALSPQATQHLLEAINKGALIVNYSGHGGPDGWTEEKLLTRKEIDLWRNLNNMPIFLTATCSFGRYDDPASVSGAEMAILNPRGGAIALLTTSRPVYANTNYLLNKAFYEALAEQKSRIGDVFKQTKNRSLSGVNNRNFILLGDPSMAFAKPTKTIFLTEINKKPPLNQTLKALSRIELKGVIKNTENEIDKSFSGKVVIFLFDKAVEKNTLGQKFDKFTYQAIQNIIYQARVDCKNGVFESSFILPKDIDYRIGRANFYFYALSNDSTMDAAGYENNIFIGGSDELLLEDKIGPIIQLSVDENNMLEVDVSDDSGINISEMSLGHAITLILNDTLTTILNPYYYAGNDFKEGQIKYFLGDLRPGKNKIYFKIWDINNNSTETTLLFEVKTKNLKLFDFNIFPNPFDTFTNFTIWHNAEEQDLVYELLIYDLQGKLIYKTQDNCYLCPNIINFGMNIENPSIEGLLFYKFILQSSSGNQIVQASGKLLLKK